MKFNLISVVIALLLCMVMLGSLSGCTSPAGKNEVKTIVCTIFPQYDWLLNILGEKAEDYNVLLLAKNGTDLHSYQPTVSDIATAGAADLFIYVGGVSDGWIDDLLAQASNEDLVSLALIDSVKAKTEIIIEGMQDDMHAHDENHDDEHGHDGNGRVHYDEHVWLSLRNARAAVSAISAALCGIDPENADTFEANAAVYNAKLTALDIEYETVVNSAARRTILFCDRFPFRYLADDYGLTCFAAFSGCSAETEASFETIVFLSGKVDELALPAVLKIENSDGKLAQTVVNSTTAKNAKILVLNSCQSVNSENISDGTTYLSIMEANLKTLEEALN